MTKKQLVERVMQIPGVDSEERAEGVISIVFQALRDRITREEADDVRAQLPTSWKALWDGGVGGWWQHLTSGMLSMNKLRLQEFIDQVQAKLPENVAAEATLRVLFHALKEQISTGEANDVAAQLPEDFKLFWKAA